MAVGIQITPDMVRQAVRVYLRTAYPDGPTANVLARVPAELPLATATEPKPAMSEVLGGLFADETHKVQEMTCRRYALRLGNWRYPHMKLVIQEFLEVGRFYFLVDTHDQLPVDPSQPGYAEWLKVKSTNTAIKWAVENALEYHGLPTLRTIRKGMSSRAAVSSESTPVAAGSRILVVDDDLDVAAAVEQVLRSRGYRVDLARDGMEALTRVRRETPDLVILDFEMPKLDGAQTAKQLKEDPATARIPILLATTTPLELIGKHDADGFLVKPCHRKVLLNLVEALLAHAGS